MAIVRACIIQRELSSKHACQNRNQMRVVKLSRRCREVVFVYSESALEVTVLVAVFVKESRNQGPD